MRNTGQCNQQEETDANIIAGSRNNILARKTQHESRQIKEQRLSVAKGIDPVSTHRIKDY